MFLSNLKTITIRKFGSVVALMTLAVLATAQIRVVHPAMINADKNSYKIMNYFSIHEKAITSVLETKRYVWLGTRGSGLIRVDKTDSTKKIFTFINSPLPSNQVDYVRESKDGTVWICSGDRLLSYKKNKWKEHGAPRQNEFTTIADLRAAPDGSIWVFNWRELIQYENKEWKFFRVDSIPGAKGEAKALFIDSKNRLWISVGENLHCRIGKEWVTYSGIFNDEDFFRAVEGITEDDQEIIWCRNRTHRMRFFDGRQWTRCREECNLKYELFNKRHWIYDNLMSLGNADIPLNKVEEIRFHPNGIPYLRSVGSIYKLNNGKRFHVVVPFAVRIEFDKKGTLYVGGEENIFKYDSVRGVSGFRDYTNAYRGEKVKARTTDFHFDNEGSLWIGNHVGFAQLRNDKWRFYSAAEFGLPDISTRAIESDYNGDKWISTWHGVIQLSKDTFLIHKTFTSGDRDIITRIKKSKSGDLWFGKRTLGVIRKTKDELIEYEPLLNGNKVLHGVQDIDFDKYGNVWIVANGVLYLYKGDKWYSLRSVLPIHITCLATRDDEVWLGTSECGVFVLKQ